MVSEVSTSKGRGSQPVPDGEHKDKGNHKSEKKKHHYV